MDGGSKLQHILPALQYVVPVLAPERAISFSLCGS
jgi:hypothetical protein